MKSIYLLAFVLNCAGTLHAQKEPMPTCALEEPADTCKHYMFRKTIGGHQPDDAWDVQTNAAGYYLLTGVSRSFRNGMDGGLVVMLQPSGKLLWSVSPGGAGATRLQSGRFTADGGSVHAGINQAGGVSSLCLLKLDANGKIAWAKKYNNELNIGNIARVIQCADGGYLMSTGAVAAAASPAYLVKTDASGNIEWSRSFPAFGNVQNAVAEGTNDFMISVFNQPSRFVYRGTLVSVDKKSGKVNWAKYYDLPGTGIVTDNIYPYAGGWLISMLFRDNAKVLVSHGFMLTTPDGHINKVFRVKSPDQANSNFLTAVTINKAGNFCLSDGVMPAGGDQDATLIEVSPNGQLVSGKRYKLPLAQLIFSIEATADGGIIMAGSTESATSSNDLWIVKTDRNLRTSCNDMEFEATIEQPPVVVTDSFANAIDLILNVQDFTANALLIDPTITDACPDPALCSSILIKGPDSVCANATVVFKAIRSNGCSQSPVWRIDPLVATISGSSSDSVNIRFKKTGWLYSSLAGKCKIITDSILVRVYMPSQVYEHRWTPGDIKVKYKDSPVQLAAGVVFSSYCWNPAYSVDKHYAGIITVIPSSDTIYKRTAIIAGGCPFADSPN